MARTEGYAEAVACLFGDEIDWPGLDGSSPSLPYRERIRVNLLGQQPSMSPQSRLCQEDGRATEGCLAEAMWSFVGDPRGDLGFATHLPAIRLNDRTEIELANIPLLILYPQLGDEDCRKAFQAAYWRPIIEAGHLGHAGWSGRTSDGVRFPSPYDYLVKAKADDPQGIR